jgi:hypothetical protein
MAWLCAGGTTTTKPVWTPCYTWWPFFIVTGITVNALVHSLTVYIGATGPVPLLAMWLITLVWFLFAVFLNNSRAVNGTTHDMSQFVYAFPAMWLQSVIVETIARTIPDENEGLLFSLVVWVAAGLMTVAMRAHFAVYH